VTPTIADGGVTVERAVQTTVLSLPALRRLRFPKAVGERSKPDTDQAARTVLAAIGLCAAVLTREQGCDLRSRCLLFPTQPIEWELLDKPGDEPTRFSLSGAEAIALLNEAVTAAKKSGLPWSDKEIVLKPSPELGALVRKSQELAASSGAEEDE
jgi:CRISPR-associated protein Csb1